MGVRFRKSIKIAPGVKLNVGKKSTGISIGGKYGGVSLNSKTGTRARVSAPGTGLSYSTKISKNTRPTNSEHYDSGQISESVEVNTTTYLLLTIFLGLFGVHRFYRKQYGLGFLYLCTAGIGSIGWIVDICIALSLFMKNKNQSDEITEETA